MGYRSDVKLIMKKSDYKRMRKGLLKNKELETPYCKQLLKYATKQKTPQAGVILTWKYIKWDECTNDAIEYVMNYISELRTPYRFIRIGEGAGTETDIESFDHFESEEDYRFINQIDWHIDFTERILKK